jgi:D-cysteine desulfhydrase
MPRLHLAHLPTPLQHPERLSAALEVELWVKRDDATGGAEAGNKVRKLELLLGDAHERGCDTVITCGGLQSNHARATALCAASLGLRVVLLLRVPGLEDDHGGAGIAPGPPHAPLAGNVLLDRLVGAELRLITAQSYERRDELMQAVAAELRAQGARPYVIPEGGSNGLGALGYVEAMAEIRRQLDQGLGGGKPFDLVVHACGSGGTAAGVALGAARHRIARQVCAMAVCADAASFETRISGIIADAQSIDRSLGDPVPWRVDDRSKGPAYAVASDEQRQRMVQAARLSGLIFDPVYTGKALCGLWALCQSGELRGRRVLFLHTGGLPGLLAQAESFEGLL